MKELVALRSANQILRLSSSRERNSVLNHLHTLIHESETELLKANEADVQAAAKKSPAFLDRLRLTPARIASICCSVQEVERLPDPLGEVIEKKTLANGLEVSRVRAPLGVIFMIFESRPNVAVEAFSLAIKSGNGLILRGGKESQRTVEVFYDLIRRSLSQAGLPAEVFWGIANSDRQIVRDLLEKKESIDVVVPRGGEELIAFVTDHSKIPIIKNDRGLCHVFVDATASYEMTEAVVENAKTQRPGVCNAMETLLIHRERAGEYLPRLHQKLTSVEWFGCPETLGILSGRPRVFAADTKSFDTEYLDMKLNCRIVDSLDEAIAHIERHGSRHSESILTESKSNAERFLQTVDAAATYWNASTRFTDGFELGLGGELGISTQKLHVRGPVGLRELTSARWIMRGKGQVRK